MKHVLFSILFLGLASPVFALTASWDRNTEPDMKEYGVYMCNVKGCTVEKTPAQQVAVVPHPTVAGRVQWIVPTATEGTLAVTARDTSGNESELSNQVPFDMLAPKAPTAASVSK